ncbi:hypothetical protein HDU92_008381 [Lobulomyces angularis]|nr:hypothetical protein HDU92_008381 [Lobulomyces angularis]
MSEYTVFVSNLFVLDKAVFNWWLLGLNVEQAIAFALKKAPNYPLRNLIISQYRNFEQYEYFLHRPKLLPSQLLFSINQNTQNYILNKYYEFDQSVVREFLGKKLTSRARKELDDVSIKTRIPLGGCRRMFDNLKRIMKRVEDSEGIIVDIIMQEFLLPRELASHYAHIVFINNYRLDTSKKKLQHLQYQDFEYVAAGFIKYLTISPDAVLEELDAGLIQDSRDLKTIIFNSKEIVEEFKSKIIVHLSQTPTIMEKGQNNALKVILRNILVIGSGLSNNKEQRDIFSNVIEKVVEPASSLNWSSKDLEMFLSSCIEVFEQIEGISANYKNRYFKSFQRLVNAMKLASVKFFK